MPNIKKIFKFSVIASIALGILAIAIFSFKKTPPTKNSVNLKTTHLYENKRPILLNINWRTEPATIDPALVTDATGVNIIRNIFMGLTQFDPTTKEVKPYLATSWQEGKNLQGEQTWTFKLRNDIPWVKYNINTGNAEQITMPNGHPGVVNAHDVVFGIKRSLHENINSAYAKTLYMIKNAKQYHQGMEYISNNDIGIQALDNETVEFTLSQETNNFPEILTLWPTYPLPKTAIVAFGTKWTEPGFIITNGPYLLTKWIHGGELNLEKNPYWPEHNQVQIEKVHGVMVSSEHISFAMYNDNLLDTSSTPFADKYRLNLENIDNQEYTKTSTCTHFLGFNNTTAVNDVSLRNALIQSIQSHTLSASQQNKLNTLSANTNELTNSEGLDNNYINTAKNILQAYLNKKRIHAENIKLILMHQTAELPAKIADIIQQTWHDDLGIDISLKSQTWKSYITEHDKNTSDMWLLNWCADYPDQNSSQAITDILQHKLSLQNSTLTPDNSNYIALYNYAETIATKPWLIRNFPEYGGIDIFNWKIDIDKKPTT